MYIYIKPYDEVERLEYGFESNKVPNVDMLKLPLHDLSI